MKIVVLDGFTLNPGDLSWAEIEALGSCTFYDRSRPDEVLQRAGGAEVIFSNKVSFDGATLQALPGLRYIGITATGTNIVDMTAAKALGITVTNVPSYGAAAIAQATFALLLELTNHVGHYNQSVGVGKWHLSPDFCYWDQPIIALQGLTMGIVGLGHIGLEVAKLADAFGMKLLVHSRSQKKTSGLKIEFCGLDDLFRQADVVSLHCSLTDDTQGICHAERLKLMKSSAYFLNISRGALVHEAALAEALNRGHIAGAGLDVLSVEPPTDDNPLLTARHCIITPHISWASRAAREKLLGLAIENLRQFIKGQPINVVNG